MVGMYHSSAWSSNARNRQGRNSPAHKLSSGLPRLLSKAGVATSYLMASKTEPWSSADVKRTHIVLPMLDFSINLL